jgi:O-methyltransferase
MRTAWRLEERYLTLLEQAITASLYPESGWYPIERNARLRMRSAKLSVRWRATLASLAASLLRRWQLKLVRARDMDPSSRLRGEDWPLFGYSLVGTARLRNLRDAIRRVMEEGIPGDLAEAGVWRGGAAIYMKAVLACAGDQTRRIWLFDSFTGLPAPSPEDAAAGDYDLSQVPELAVTLEAVRENFARFALLDERVIFVPGWFEQTLVAPPVEKLALLRIDADLFSSTKRALEGLAPKVSPGGFIVVDDYGGWPGCRLAVQRHLASLPSPPELRWIDRHAVFWRTPARDRPGSHGRSD